MKLVSVWLLLLVSTVSAEDSSLTIIDEKDVSHVISTIEFGKLTRAKLNVDGNAEYEGVLLPDLLQSVGVVFGKELKGPRAASVVVLEAADGYRTVLALLEIDSATTDKRVLLADKRNGKTLDAKEGPFRLVIPDEKRPVRWIRMVRTIKIVNLKSVLLEKPSTK